MQDLDRSEEQQVSAATDCVLQDNSHPSGAPWQLPQRHSKLKYQRYEDFSKLILVDFMIESFSRSDAGSDSQWKISQRQIQELCGGEL